MKFHEHEAKSGGRGSLAGLAARALKPAELTARQETFRGFGDGLSLAFELAIVPFLFGFAGYALDRRLGTAPIFMIVLALVAIIGLFLRTWFNYEQQMQAHDAAGPWAKARAVPGPPGPPGPAGADREPPR